MIAAAAIVCFSVLSFLMEDRFSLRQFWDVIDPLGGGGHHELFVSLIKQFKDPSLFPQDLYMTANHHAVVPLISLVLAPLHTYLSIPLQILFVVAEDVTRLVLFFSIYRLARSLFADRFIAIIAMALCVIPKCGIGYYYLYTVTDFNAELGLALNVLSLSFFFESRWRWAILFNALSYNVHPILPLWISVFYGIYAVFCLPKTKELGMLLVIFIAAALPFEILMFRYIQTAVSAPPHPALWYQLMMPVVGSHFFPSLQAKVDPRFWYRLSFYLLAGALAIKKYPLAIGQMRKTFLLSGCFFGFAVVGWVFTDVFPVMVVLKAQPARSSIYLLVLALVVTAQFLFEEAKGLDQEESWVLKWLRGLFWTGLALLIADVPMHHEPVWVAFLFLALVYDRKPARVQLLLPGYGKISIFLLGLLLVMPFPRIARAYSHYRETVTPRADWKAAQLWARDHTAKEDQFIVPLDLAGWRIHAERSTFVTMNDIPVALLMDPSTTVEYARRLRLMQYTWRISKDDIRREYGKLRPRIEDAEKKFSGKTARQIFAEYPNVRYAVTYRRKTLDLPQVYENKSFRIYRIKSRST